jgi:hypothetical protein
LHNVIPHYNMSMYTHSNTHHNKLSLLPLFSYSRYSHSLLPLFSYSRYSYSLLTPSLTLLYHTILFSHASLTPISHPFLTLSLLRDATASVRFIANAAGGLLPVLAENLKSTFQATILTSYGMTEW